MKPQVLSIFLLLLPGVAALVNTAHDIPKSFTAVHQRREFTRHPKLSSRPVLRKTKGLRAEATSSISSDGEVCLIGEEASCARSTKEKIVTGTLIVLWYAASVVCNQSSKTLLSTALNSEMLTFFQFLVSALTGAAVIFGARAAPFEGVTSKPLLGDLSKIALANVIGFGLMNACFGVMHVSMVMTLRAAEPLSTLLVSLALNPKTNVPPARLGALLFVVAGCALSALGAHGPTALGLTLALTCNFLFAARNILGKQVGQRMGPVSQFFHLSWIGAIIQAIIILGGTVVKNGVLPALPTSAVLPTLILNGVSFYAYLQLSWVVLNRMSAVSHSLTNSLRRPATIIAALAISPAPMSLLNYGGIVAACIGALLYGFL